jgi:undecaprenyl-diphosphatase
MTKQTSSWSKRKHLRILRSRTVAQNEPIWPKYLTPYLLLIICFTALLMIYDRETSLYSTEFSANHRPILKLLTLAGESHWTLIPSLLVLLITGIQSVSAMAASDKIRLIKWRIWSAFIALSILGTGLISVLFKKLIGRMRPVGLNEYGAHKYEPFSFDAVWNSFPSGHSTTIGALTMILILWFPRFKSIWIILGIGFGLTRLLLGKHYASDVLVGLNLGLIATLLLARYFAKKGWLFNIKNGAIIPETMRRFKIL